MTEAQTKPVLTRAQKYAATIEVLTKRIAADTAKLAEVQLELDTSEKLANVGTGTIIVAKLGRALARLAHVAGRGAENLGGVGHGGLDQRQNVLLAGGEFDRFVHEGG